MYRIVINNHVSDKSVVTIGNFDGLHLGHLRLFASLQKISNEKNYRRIAITFEPLPLEYFFDQKSKQRLHRLCLLRDKFYLLSKNDLIDEMVVLHFNDSIANLSPVDFINKILKVKLNTKHVVIGHDFKFGKGGIGTASDFVNMGIECTTVEPFLINQQRVSSSIIRDVAKNNDLTLVKKYLGRNLHYTSRIIHGNKMGRKFGVPTINLSLGKNRPVLHGIYIARVYIEGNVFNAVASIGKNPTTNDKDIYKLEAHLLGVDLNLYGKIATVEVLKFIREERKFEDLDKLFEQIHMDMQEARVYFETL